MLNEDVPIPLWSIDSWTHQGWQLLKPYLFLGNLSIFKSNVFVRLINYIWQHLPNTDNKLDESIVHLWVWNTGLTSKQQGIPVFVISVNSKFLWSINVSFICPWHIFDRLQMKPIYALISDNTYVLNVHKIHRSLTHITTLFFFIAIAIWWHHLPYIE